MMLPHDEYYGDEEDDAVGVEENAFQSRLHAGLTEAHRVAGSPGYSFYASQATSPSAAAAMAAASMYSLPEATTAAAIPYQQYASRMALAGQLALRQREQYYQQLAAGSQLREQQADLEEEGDYEDEEAAGLSAALLGGQVVAGYAPLAYAALGRRPLAYAAHPSALAVANAQAAHSYSAAANAAYRAAAAQHLHLARQAPGGEVIEIDDESEVDEEEDLVEEELDEDEEEEEEPPPRPRPVTNTFAGRKRKKELRPPDATSRRMPHASTGTSNLQADTEMAAQFQPPTAKKPRVPIAPKPEVARASVSQKPQRIDAVVRSSSRDVAIQRKASSSSSSQRSDPHVPPSTSACPESGHRPSPGTTALPGKQSSRTQQAHSSTSRSASSQPSSAQPAATTQVSVHPLAGPYVQRTLSGIQSPKEVDVQVHELSSKISFIVTRKKKIRDGAETIEVGPSQVEQIASEIVNDRQLYVKEAVRTALEECQAKHESILKHKLAVQAATGQSQPEPSSQSVASYARELHRVKMEHMAEVEKLKKEHEQEVAQLKEKMAEDRKNQARSLNAYMKASVQSLRLMRKKSMYGQKPSE